MLIYPNLKHRTNMCGKNTGEKKQSYQVRDPKCNRDANRADAEEHLLLFLYARRREVGIESYPPYPRHN